MWSLLWLTIGFITLVSTALLMVRDAAITVRQGILIVAISILFSIWGPIATVVVVYWFWRGWSYRFPVDDDNRIIYPWRE